jgi:hypothetical protein
MDKAKVRTAIRTSVEESLHAYFTQITQAANETLGDALFGQGIEDPETQVAVHSWSLRNGRVIVTARINNQEESFKLEE